MNFKKNLLLSFLLLISTLCFSQKIELPPVKDFIEEIESTSTKDISYARDRIMDFAQILSPQNYYILRDSLYKFEKSSSTQIIILTLQQIPDGEDEFSFSMKVAKRLKIGQAKKDNGVFVLVTTQGDRKFKIYPGRGLEGAIPDILIDQFFRNVARPLLKKGDYDQAMIETFNFISSASRGEFKADKKSTANKIPKTAVFILIAVFFVFYLILSRVARKNRGMTTIGGRNHGIRNNPNELFFIASLLGGLGGGGRSSGHGSSGGGGGIDFGGFSGGGGSFGGGGGGGSW